MVIKTGPEVTKYKEGDRVTVEPAVTCGVCDACRRGEYGYCEHISFNYREGHGALAYYFMAKEDKVYRLPIRSVMKRERWQNLLLLQYMQ